MRYAESMLIAVLSLGCGAVNADVYKWVDETGTVNYSNVEPPKRSGATKLDPESPRVTVYKAIKPTEAELARADAYLRYRQEIAIAEASASGGYGSANMNPYPAWYQQCQYEMWADCDDPRALNTRYGSGLWDSGWGWGWGWGPTFWGGNFNNNKNNNNKNHNHGRVQVPVMKVQPTPHIAGRRL